MEGMTEGSLITAGVPREIEFTRQGSSIIESNMSDDNSDSIQSSDDEDQDDSELDDESSKEFRLMNDPENCPTKETFDKLRALWKEDREKQKRRVEDLKKRIKYGGNISNKVERKKKVTQVKNLSDTARLPPAKEAMMLHILRDKMFCTLKIVDRSILKDGKLVTRLMKLVGITMEKERKCYYRHLELAISKKIGEFRSNSIRKLRKTFLGMRDELTSKLRWVNFLKRE
jgi:hypothetical protein